MFTNAEYYEGFNHLVKINDRHKNYNNWIISIFKPYLGNLILEIGSGSGNITEILLNCGYRVIATDIAEGNLKYIIERLINVNKNNLLTLTIDIENFNTEESDATLSEVDTILCINVLEHIQNDFRAINNMHEVLLNSKAITPKRLLLLVPAFNIIYGTLDEGYHYRRYRKKHIQDLLEKSGFKIVQLFYMNLLGFFGWFFSGKILKNKDYSENQIGFFDKLVPFLKTAECIIKPPFGVSVIAVGEIQK